MGEPTEDLFPADPVVSEIDRFRWPGVGLGRGELAEGTVRPGRVGPLATITAPTLLVLGDRDFTTVEHGALMKQLIPGSQLAILPGTTHMQVTRRADLLLPMLARFLD